MIIYKILILHLIDNLYNKEKITDIKNEIIKEIIIEETLSNSQLI